MFGFIKKLFGAAPAPVEAPVVETKVETVNSVPYKVETPVASKDEACCGIEGCTHDTAPVAPAPKKKPAPKKQSFAKKAPAKKPAPKKPASKKSKPAA